MDAAPEKPAATRVHQPDVSSTSQTSHPSIVVTSVQESPISGTQTPPSQPLPLPAPSSRDYREGDIVGASAAPLDAENRGRKLLEKMGYKPGTALGRGGGEVEGDDSVSRVDPLNIVFRTSRAGLGSVEPPTPEKSGSDGGGGEGKKKKKKKEGILVQSKADGPGYGDIPFRHPFSIPDLRNPNLFIFPVQVRQTLVTTRRDQIALARICEILDYYNMAYGNNSLPGNAYNVILHRCIRTIVDASPSGIKLKEENGVVMDEIADETLWALVQKEYSKKSNKLEKGKIKKEMRNHM